jgi:uncharacterized protein (TIGR04141 family)
MARGPRKRDLTFYLVKDNVATFDAVLPPQDDTVCFELGPDRGLPFEGRLVIKNPTSNPPWWVGWLRTSLNEIGDFLNTSNAAALVLRLACGRLFVVTFGYGRNLMSLDSFERDFGLRVALNVVDPESLKSVDARTFEQLTMMTRSQTSRATSFENFRVSQAEDIVKGVTGTPRDPAIGSRITGADAAKVMYVPNLTLLHDKCNQLLDAYGSDRYREAGFGFIDDLRTVRDPARIASLNEELLRRLRDRDFGTVHMAPPEVTDVQDIDQFVFGEFPDDVLLDLDVERYCARANEDERELAIDTLRKGKVGVTYRGGVDVHYLWSVFDCLVAEIRDGERLFVLSGGTWYQIEGDFAERVAHAVEQRGREPEFLPMGRVEESERAYNERAAGEGGLHLLDGCLVRPAGARSPIEFCDLLDGNRRIVHVKRKSRSSTLSHLFSQGVVSAETFLRDTTFRTALSGELRERGREDAARLIPAERPVAQDWEIVYAVVGGAVGDGPRALPFFSQLNFKIAAERLESLQFRVSLRQVPTPQAA